LTTPRQTARISPRGKIEHYLLLDNGEVAFLHVNIEHLSTILLRNKDGPDFPSRKNEHYLLLDKEEL